MKAAIVLAVVSGVAVFAAGPARADDGPPAGFSATIRNECTDDGIAVDLQNPTPRRAVFSVEWSSADGSAWGSQREEVARQSSTTLVIHVPERVALDVTASVADTVVQKVTLTRDCSKPSASIALACADGGGAAVELRNDGVGAVDFFIDKNMATFGGPYAVVGGTSQRVVIPLAAREFAEVTVSTGDGVVVADEVVIHDCSVPAVVSITVSCPEGGAAVVVSNSGTEPATFRFTKNGVPVGGDLEVAAGGTGRVVIAMTEDETATIGVETAAGALTSQSVTRDCAQVAGIKITTTSSSSSSTTSGAVLPVTGSDTGPLVVLAGVLLLVGGLLLALSDRRRRTA